MSVSTKNISETQEQIIASGSPEQTEKIAAEFAKQLEAGDVVAFFGNLGSGKTTFIRGMSRTLGVEDLVSSPTFTLINEYPGPTPIYHFDFYRIEDPDEIWELGWQEYFYGDGICLIEWADRIADFLPEKRIEVHLSGTGSDRQIQIVRSDNF